MPAAGDVRDHGFDAAEQQRAAERRPWLPAREHHERDGDPAAAAGHSGDPELDADDGNVGAGQSDQRGADDDRQRRCSETLMPAASAAAGFSPTERIRSPIIVENSHQLTMKKISDGEIHDRILREEDLADDRNIRKRPDHQTACSPSIRLFCQCGDGSDRTGEALAKEHDGEAAITWLTRRPTTSTGEQKRDDARRRHRDNSAMPG